METKNHNNTLGKKLFETSIKCELYKPMIGKVVYGDEPEGIPEKTSPEVEAEMGWKYVICSPLSPYAIGGIHWDSLCKIADGKSLSDIFHAEVDFTKNTITVYIKEEA